MKKKKKLWFNALFGEIFNPKNMYWIHTSEGVWPNYFSYLLPNYEKQYEIMGILLALAIYEEYEINIKFP